MLGDSAVLLGSGGSGEAVTAAAGVNDGAVAVASGGSNSRDDERGRIDEGERSFGGNRWPRQETLALLRIRSDMDVAFRDATVKGPLWEEVSRKLAELGYHRNAKKCKEKFENVYKYHKRTKEGRSSKSDGKTYRFFDQLEALDHHHNHPPTTSQSSNPSKPPQSTPAALPVSSIVATITATTAPTTTITTIVPMPPVANTIHNSVPHVAVPSTTTTTLPMAMPQGIVTTTPSINLTIPSYPTTTTTNPTNFPPPPITNPTTNTTIPISFPNIPNDLLSNSSTSSTSSDETLEGRRKRKRKWKDFFERLMKDVIETQEELQKRFLEAIEKREHDRMVREEAWRVQEMQRINREREILAQERSIAAAKDAAVMAFLQKIAEQQNVGPQLNNINIAQQPQPQSQSQLQPQTTPQPQQQLQLQIQPAAQQIAPPAPAPTPPPVQQRPAPLVAQLGPPTQPVVQPLAPQQHQQQQVTNMEMVKADNNNNGENLMAASSSRWPKVEVEALIKLRTGLDPKYQENGPKGPLWEEISASMRKLGYNRSSKRCKEKWENINKYFKKVKESNKKRPEDSKTCPYFHQLDALYRERNKLESNQVVKPESMVAPLMVRPEQQWPPQQEVTMEDVEINDRVDRHHREGEDDEDEEKDREEEEEEEEDEEDESGGGGKYERVASKAAAAASVGASGGE